MYIFKDKYKYTDPLNIVFLCGSSYKKNSEGEKRNVLKIHLESMIPNCRVIILEENFNFRKTTKTHLAYDDIFLFSLAQVEELASLFANSVIIIHETISTAAELGMFANNPALLKKICLLTPDAYSVEEEKISSFIRFAFLQANAPESHIGAHYVFFPDTTLHKDSQYKSEYHTSFHNNEIGCHLSDRIVTFVKRESFPIEIKFNLCRYGKPWDGYSIDYFVDIEQKNVAVFVHPDVLKAQILSLFLQDGFQNEIKKSKKIREHVTCIQAEYSQILKNSVSFHGGLDLTNYSFSIYVKESHVSIRQAIGYCIYMLQAINYINLEQHNEKDASIRTIGITRSLESIKPVFKSLIMNQGTTAFGRLEL